MRGRRRRCGKAEAEWEKVEDSNVLVNVVVVVFVVGIGEDEP